MKNFLYVKQSSNKYTRLYTRLSTLKLGFRFINFLLLFSCFNDKCI